MALIWQVEWASISMGMLKFLDNNLFVNDRINKFTTLKTEHASI